jgi:hypothetical protein
MAPYDDSESSGGEEEFTETNVLLGYASKDADDDTISRLGGRPVSVTLVGHLDMRSSSQTDLVMA